MAQILNPSIQIRPDSYFVGGPVEVEVTYTVRFTPMERLLANHGLSFYELIGLYEVDTPSDSLTNDDFLLWMHPHEPISSTEIAGAAGNQIVRTRIRTYDRIQLRGPNDDGSRYWERIRARILVGPVPSNALEVEGDQEISGYAHLDTSGPVLEQTPFAG